MLSGLSYTVIIPDDKPGLGVENVNWEELPASFTFLLEKPTSRSLNKMYFLCFIYSKCVKSNDFKNSWTSSINRDDKKTLQKEIAYCSNWKLFTIYYFLIVLQKFHEQSKILYENQEVIFLLDLFNNLTRDFSFNFSAINFCGTLWMVKL